MDYKSEKKSLWIKCKPVTRKHRGDGMIGLSGNVGENWRRFKQRFLLYLSAIDGDHEYHYHHSSCGW